MEQIQSSLWFWVNLDDTLWKTLVDIICTIRSFYFHGGCDSLVAKSCLTLVTPWTAAHQVPLSMRFPRQEYWSGLPSLRHYFILSPGRALKVVQPATFWWSFFTSLRQFYLMHVQVSTQPKFKDSLFRSFKLSLSFWATLFSLVPLLQILVTGFSELWFLCSHSPRSPGCLESLSLHCVACKEPSGSILGQLQNLPHLLLFSLRTWSCVVQRLINCCFICFVWFSNCVIWDGKSNTWHSVMPTMNAPCNCF